MVFQPVARKLELGLGPLKLVIGMGGRDRDRLLIRVGVLNPRLVVSAWLRFCCLFLGLGL